MRGLIFVTGKHFFPCLSLLRFPQNHIAQRSSHADYLSASVFCIFTSNLLSVFQGVRTIPSRRHHSKPVRWTMCSSLPIHLVSFRSLIRLFHAPTRRTSIGCLVLIPDSKVHETNMGPTWGRQDPGGPHVGHVNLAIWDILTRICTVIYNWYLDA